MTAFELRRPTLQNVTLGTALLLLLLSPAGCGKKFTAGGNDNDAAVSGDASGIQDAAPQTDADNTGICGDHVLNTGEECDDGNQSSDDECLPNCTWACGDGVVNAVELCDTGIPVGQPGACPTSCDDSSACTTDNLAGSACLTECVHGDITSCSDGDGCCPSGCDESNDNDCNANCGNGIIETGETCDPPSSCPTSCDDSNDCTADALTGDAANCDAACSNTPISVCAAGDSCCPVGCDQTTDGDCNPACGNGVVEAGETCDPPGSCPTSCDDTNDCTSDTTTGASATCDVVCTHTPVTTCANGDGCCPSACDATNDSECTPSCGNGVVEAGETCDPPGSCPTSCDDTNDCTADTMTGSAASCDVACSNTPISSCTGGDSCCPSGCNATNDTDCSASCGNSVIESGETCDPPGTCPTSCDDTNDCTTDQMTGSPANCNVACTHTPVTNCLDSDGCCPGGCNANNDSDCSPVCGNGAVESGETCDPPGSCPASCDDTNDCTADSLSGSAATCDVVCTNSPISSCTSGDGCCPTGCNSTNDNDCNPVCGNSIIESGETCDPPGSCPSSCDDSDNCTADQMTGGAATCNVVCTNTPISSCTGGDACCPAGCHANNDSDCSPVCGNGVTEAGEGCDDGNTTSGDGCDSNCQPETGPTVFRVDDAWIRDPHFFLQVVFCFDVTDGVILGNDGVNVMLNDAIDNDIDGDGALDLSLLLLFRPLDQSVPGGGPAEIGVGICTPPAASTICSPDVSAPLQPTTFSNQSTGDCLAENPVHTSGYTPGITSASAPCFLTGAVDMTISIAGTAVTLQLTEVAATYLGNPATGMVNGLMRGFLSETDAQATTVDLGTLGTFTLDQLLQPGACGGGDDRDSGPGGVVGWYFYINFTAVEVLWTGP